MHRTPLTKSDERLLDHLSRRPPWLGRVNAGVAAAALCVLFWITPSDAAQTAVASLCGVLIGVFFEQRHLSRLRGIISALRSDNDHRARP